MYLDLRQAFMCYVIIYQYNIFLASARSAPAATNDILNAFENVAVHNLAIVTRKLILFAIRGRSH